MIKHFLYRLACSRTTTSVFITFFTEIQGYSTFVNTSNATSRSSTNDKNPEYGPGTSEERNKENITSSTPIQSVLSIGPDALRYIL